MEPHTMDLAHDLSAPHHEGVYGPLLWVDAASGRCWQEGSAGHGTPELGGGTNALMVWVGRLVVVVSMGVAEEQQARTSRALRTFLRQPELAIVFERSWLPDKAGTKVAVDAADAVPRRDLARAEAYALVQARWLDREQVLVELEAESFSFEARTVIDAAGRLRYIIETAVPLPLPG
jgi:hypothetical protein